MEGGLNALHLVCCLVLLGKSYMREINLIFTTFLVYKQKVTLCYKVELCEVLSSVSIQSAFPGSQALCQVRGLKMNRKHWCSRRESFCQRIQTNAVMCPENGSMQYESEGARCDRRWDTFRGSIQREVECSLEEETWAAPGRWEIKVQGKRRQWQRHVAQKHGPREWRTLLLEFTSWKGSSRWCWATGGAGWRGPACHLRAIAEVHGGAWHYLICILEKNYSWSFYENWILKGKNWIQVQVKKA